MIRKHENAYSIPAGFLTIAVHALLFAGLFFSMNWKSVHVATNVMEVELWEQMPAPQVAQKQPKPTPKPKEVPTPPKPEPKPEPVKVEEPKVEAPKVDIALQKKKEEEAKKKEAERLKKLADEKKKKAAEKKRKADEKKRKLAEQLLKQDQAAEQEEKRKKVAAAMLAADEKAAADRRASAAVQGEVDKYISKIQAKVRGNVNKSLCGTGNPTLKFKVDILPTGDIARDPSLVKSSGVDACDEAVSRAILASQPLPLPKDPTAKAKFRNLTLIFKPNE